MSHPLIDAIAGMQEPAAMQLAQQLLDEGQDALKILELCREALELVGKKFEEGVYFLPELILAGEMLKKISRLAKPYLTQDSETKAEKRGTVVIGTVKGDIHDIGKDIVVFLLDVNGFEVHDLGIDVPAQRFVDAIQEHQPQVVGLCALLTLAFKALKSTVAAIDEAGLRDRVKIMIGGATLDEKVKAYAGADAYGADAVAAVNLAKHWTGSK